MLRGQIVGTVPSPPRPLDGSGDLLLTVAVNDVPFELTVGRALAHATWPLTPDAAVLVDLSADAGTLRAQHLEVLGQAAPHNTFRLTGTCTPGLPGGPVWLTVPELGEVRLLGADECASPPTQGVYALGELCPAPDGWTFHARRLETVTAPRRA